jgi:hypothetical protein
MGSTILVIGYYDSREVDSFSWWQDLPNISEYDTIIIDTTKLVRHWAGRIEHVSENDYTLLHESDLDDKIDRNLELVRNKLLEKMEFDASIYVLYTPEISIYRPPRSPIHTQFWRPFSFDTISEPGKVINVVESSYQTYFNDFKEWKLYFVPSSIGISEIRDYYLGKWAVTFEVNEIAVNKVRKPLAFELVLFFHRYATDEEALRYEPAERPYESVAHHKGSRLVLLPVSSEYDTVPCIENILQISRQFEQAPPPTWTDDIEIPGEAALKNEIKSFEQQVEKITAKMGRVKELLTELQKHKELLYETGLPLQKIVESTLVKLGAAVEPSVVTDEFIMNAHNRRILVEVKGNSKSISKSDLGQLITDLGEHLKATDEEIDGILIGNAWRLLPVKERNTHNKPIFPQNVVRIAERRNIGLLSTTELFKAFCETLEDPNRKKDILDKVVGGQGVITF